MKEDECTKEKCEKFAKAFKSNDTAVCKEDNDCKAVMLLDEDLTLKENRKDFIRFAKAIRDSSIKGCASINDETMRVSCEVYINKDKNACQRLLGFNRFQQEYCRDSCN